MNLTKDLSFSRTNLKKPKFKILGYTFIFYIILGFGFQNFQVQKSTLNLSEALQQSENQRKKTELYFSNNPKKDFFKSQASIYEKSLSGSHSTSKALKQEPLRIKLKRAPAKVVKKSTHPKLQKLKKSKPKKSSKKTNKKLKKMN
jgi:hypothetical protein